MTRPTDAATVNQAELAALDADECNLRRHSDHRFCCAACHRAFSSMQVFDWHRRNFECRDPADANGAFVGREIPGAVGNVTVWGVGGKNPWAES